MKRCKGFTSRLSAIGYSSSTGAMITQISLPYRFRNRIVLQKSNSAFHKLRLPKSLNTGVMGRLRDPGTSYPIAEKHYVSEVQDSSLPGSFMSGARCMMTLFVPAKKSIFLGKLFLIVALYKCRLQIGQLKQTPLIVGTQFSIQFSNVRSGFCKTKAEEGNPSLCTRI